MRMTRIQKQAQNLRLTPVTCAMRVHLRPILFTSIQTLARQLHLFTTHPRFAKFTAVLSTGQSEVFAQDLEQCFMRSKSNLGRLAIQGEFNMGFLLCSARHLLPSNYQAFAVTPSFFFELFRTVLSINLVLPI